MDSYPSNVLTALSESAESFITPRTVYAACAGELLYEVVLTCSGLSVNTELCSSKVVACVARRILTVNFLHLNAKNVCAVLEVVLREIEGCTQLHILVADRTILRQCKLCYCLVVEKNV